MSFREEQRGRPEQALERRSQAMHGRKPQGMIGRILAIASLIVVAVVVVVILSGTGSHKSQPSQTATAASTQSSHTSTRPAPQPAATAVPILVYHVINSQPAGSTASASLYVPTAEFTSQMQALKAGGWHAVTLNQLQAHWAHGASLGPGKPIVITFDNGYASQYTNALPVLKQLGWVGVLNLQLSGLSPSEGGLSTTQIKGLLSAGWELDTQGLSHVDLINLNPTEVGNELTSARQMLQTNYGVTPNWFSYPLGDYNTAVIAAARTAGYIGATTVNPGWASPQQDRFRLPRLVVVGGTSSSSLLAQIATAKTTTTVPPTYTGQGLA